MLGWKGQALLPYLMVCLFPLGVGIWMHRALGTNEEGQGHGVKQLSSPMKKQGHPLDPHSSLSPTSYIQASITPTRVLKACMREHSNNQL